MKRLAIPFIIVLIAIGFYLIQSDEDRFSQYQWRNRTPAAKSIDPDKSLGREKQKEKLSSSTDEAQATQERIKKKVNYHQLRPLDSRSIAAQSSKEANHWQDVDPKPFWIQDEEYLISKNMFAVDKRGFDQNDPRIRGEFLGHYLLAANSAPSDSFPVLIHKESSKYAILTKVLKVKLNRFEDMNYLFNLPHQIQESFENISVVLYRFEDLDVLNQAYNIAKKDPRVRRVNIEILKGARINQ